MTLLDRIGGEQAIYLITDKFYDYSLSDQVIKHCFENKDIKQLKASNKRLLIDLFRRHSSVTQGNLNRIDQKSIEEKIQIDQFWNNMKAALEYYRIKQTLLSYENQNSFLMSAFVPI